MRILHPLPSTPKERNAMKRFGGWSTGKRNENDFYRTPYSMKAQLLQRETLQGNVLEPACGSGAIVTILEGVGLNVTAYDLMDGTIFLNERRSFSAVITNPPWRLTTEFILQAKRAATDRICFLPPTNYLHGEERYHKI